MSHLPVMLDEVVRALEPRDGALYIDGTFGAGGYSRAILSAADCRLIGIDRDPSVIPAAEQLGQASGGRFVFVQAPFSHMAEVIRANGGESVDGIVLDIGVSSMQIDQAERGFSFMRAGPLDMRMARSGPSAADAVNLLGEQELADIFYVYGDERRSRRIAKQIVEARAEAPIETTDRLAAIVTRATGGKHSKIHPATKVFQALRIYVNDELGELARALEAAEQILAPRGRLVVVTFHSLEDRMVKDFLRARSGQAGGGGSRHLPAAETGPAIAPSFSLLHRKALAASAAEIAANPRSRSAKLRVAIRTEAPAWSADPAVSDKVVSLARLEAAL
ncbi:16S rRNA (cytosine(1402)-N(4))-methyltransferase RsmH [Maricaulis sp.]|uniref:16S rRNA (cytosine(1402)-N(4))-methyltransferase RsmH n=1 Tax=Maricaulis sp. TaxID=1486257 RepID=UPI003A8F569B